VTKVKICGVTTLEDALLACEAGADSLGFNFAEEAKPKGRHVSPDAAQRIIEQLPPFVTATAVCVNEPTERLLEYLGFVDWVQLHGEETVDACRPVAARAIKAFRAGAGFEPESALAYPVAAFLIDAHVPGARGGTGVTCDWDLARRTVALGRPVILAGGLTPDNVAEAVRAVRPYAVDTAGGVESAPGKKDHGKIRAFIHNAKHALALS
jgi:phosphoribosylanthranilate isomerase